jgi:hypothetical protein
MAVIPRRTAVRGSDIHLSRGLRAGGSRRGEKSEADRDERSPLHH